MANELFETGGVGETKLHVAMFVHRFPLVSETFVINQVVGLMRLGYEVDIYSFGAQPPSAALTQPDVAQYRLLEHTKYPAVSPRDGLKFLRCGVRQAATLLRSQPKVLARSLDLSSHRREALLLRLLSMVWLLRDRKTGSLGIAVGYPNILWLMNHYYPQEHPHDYPH
jgi:colanic acid/amylovoran biosynthesis glycosyltransferase